MKKYSIRNIAALALTGAVLLGSLSILPAGEAGAVRSIQEIKKDKEELQTNIDSTSSDLAEIIANIKVLEDEVADKEAEIADATANLEAAQASADKQYADLKVRMAYNYENGSQSLFQVLLSSGSIGDFLNRVEYARDVYQYDQDMLTTYQGTVEDIKELKTELEKEELDLETQKAELDAQRQTLNTTLQTMKAQMGNIDAEYEAAKKEAARIAEEKRKAREEAARKRREEEARRNTARQRRAQAAKKGSAQAGGSSSTGESSEEDNKQEVEGGDPAGSVNGSSVVSYAKQFVGNPYVWGGNSLTEGCDCSGFVQQVYRHFGYLEGGRQTSGSLRSVGSPVGIDYIKPGDIVCYPGHVAIYAGGGQIVEAQSTRTGITDYRSVYCHTIVAIRRL